LTRKFCSIRLRSGNELNLRSVVVCFASLIAINDASAGWFGPSTYDECILDEMKGRLAYMMETVKRDCTAKFCTEVPVTYTEEEKVAFAAAAKKAAEAADECKRNAEASPNYYTRLNAVLCGLPEPYLPTTKLVCK
jgi:hypothetical protein